jgi:hypothetical protein
MSKSSLRLSVPYNHADDYAKVILEPFGTVIGEVYLPVHISVAYTGRRWHGPVDPREYNSQLSDLYAALKKTGIRLGFAANLYPATFATALRIEDEIVRLHGLYPGSSFFVSAFESAASLHKEYPDIDLQPSTLARVNDPVRAFYWQSMVGS